MVFRADESSQRGYDAARDYLVGRNIDSSEKQRSLEVLEDIVDQIGPAIDLYPSWHPLVVNHDSRHPVYFPNQDCGYKGLDHTVSFAQGFITCPYKDSGNCDKIFDSVSKLPENPAAQITAEEIDVQFYHPDTKPILVRCEWNKVLLVDKTIPLSVAMPLILEKEVPCWRWATMAETWESMRTDLMGTPHGARSSLFVNQETGQAIKKVWNALIYTGMFGPIKV